MTVDAGGALPEPIKLRDMPMLPISTEVLQEPVKPEEHIGIGENRHLLPGHPALTAKMVFYHKAQDTMRTYTVKGVVVEIVENEPSLEDRMLVNALTFADLLADQLLDLGDLKQIVGLAIERHLESEDGNPIMQDKLIKLYKDLGGQL